MHGWNWGLLTGVLRRGAGLLRTTVVGVAGVVDVYRTEPDAGWGI